MSPSRSLDGAVPRSQRTAWGCAGRATWSGARRKLCSALGALGTKVCQKNLIPHSSQPHPATPAGERGNKEEKWREKDVSCWYLLVQNAGLGAQAASMGEAHTYAKTVLQPASRGYGFCDELTLSHLLYFSPNPPPVFTVQVSSE